MQSLQELRGRREALAKSLHGLLNDNPGAKWNAELGAKYDAGIAEVDAIDAEIGRINALNERVAQDALRERAGEAAAAAAPAGARALLNKWLKGGDNALTAAEWADIRATMSTTTNSQGGYTVPTEVARELVNALKDYSGVRQVATVISTEGYGPLNFPTSDGTAEVGEVIAENTTATASDPSFGVATVTAWKFSSKIIAVPFELLQDTAIDMEAFVRGRIADRLGRIMNTKFTVGTGTSEPYGVVTQATSGKVGTTGQTTSVIFDDLVDLVHSVDIAYRRGASCRFMLADASFAKVRKLKDSQTRPVFIPGWDGLGRPMPDTLLGYPVVVNNDVAAMAANAKSILFGDFSKYLIRDVMDLTLFRFTDSAYAKLGQVGYLAWQRSGGNLLDTAAIKYYQNSAT